MSLGFQIHSKIHSNYWQLNLCFHPAIFVPALFVRGWFFRIAPELYRHRWQWTANRSMLIHANVVDGGPCSFVRISKRMPFLLASRTKSLIFLKNISHSRNVFRFSSVKLMPIFPFLGCWYFASCSHLLSISDLVCQYRPKAWLNRTHNNGRYFIALRSCYSTLISLVEHHQ